MSYTSIAYLGFILMGSFFFYSIVPLKHKWKVLLIFSYLFYFINSGKYIVFILFSTLSIYFGGLLLNKIDDGFSMAKKALPKENKKEFKSIIGWQKKCVCVSIVLLNLGILVYLKYSVFFGQVFCDILSIFHIKISNPMQNMMLPLGISFYTLSAISYIVDVYRGKYKASDNLGKVALFLVFFPHIVEGPIGRFDLLGDQVYEGHPFDYKNATMGLQLVFWGLFKKIVINYERMGNVGFCFSMYPVLKKLYPDKKDLAAAMKRHLTLYQTSHYLATFQMGITAAMEEENAQDADFDTDSIGAVKTALMGPIAGIGDSLFWGTIKVIATGIGCSLALQGNILGPILFLLIFNIPAYLCRWFGVFLGYKMGRESMAKIVESGLMKVVMEVASIMGIMVVGGMTMDMTSINFITQIGSGEEASTIQDLLNGIVPGLPVLLLFGVTYWLLKKKVNPLLIMLIMLVLGIAGAFFGFLG